MADSGQDAARLRIDKFLWFARLAKSRGVAQRLAEAGHLRLDGRRVDRAHACVRVGSVVSLPHGDGARVLRVEVLPVRRGPFVEARACYTALGEDSTSPPPTVRPELVEGLCFLPSSS